MSLALYNKGGLRFWSEHEINRRNWLTTSLSHKLNQCLVEINSAWQFFRMEGPTLIPRDLISSAYDDSDIFSLTGMLGDSSGALRAETTASSYLYAKYLLDNGAKAPLCVWQAGKSYRQESNDGASPSKLRYNEFYQLEFQCIFRTSTKADYYTPAIKVMEEVIRTETGAPESRTIPSDRLPGYSEITTDIEIPHNGDWKEMASCSIRNDFILPDFKVVEIAIGLDRLLDVKTGPLK